MDLNFNNQAAPEQLQQPEIGPKALISAEIGLDPPK